MKKTRKYIFQFEIDWDYENTHEADDFEEKIQNEIENNMNETVAIDFESNGPGIGMRCFGKIKNIELLEIKLKK